MSRLETEILNCVGDLVEPTRTTISTTDLEALRLHKDLLGKWLLKSAIVVEHSAIKPKSPVVAERLYGLPNSELPLGPHFLVFVSSVRTRDIAARLTNTIPTKNGGKLHMHLRHREGLSFSIQIGHIVMRLLHCPDAYFAFNLDAPSHDGFSVAPLLLNSQLGYPNRLRHEFETFNSFVNSVIIDADSRAPLVAAR